MMNGKALPRRPSPDEYGIQLSKSRYGSPQIGIDTSRTGSPQVGYDSRQQTGRMNVPNPNNGVILEGYRKDIITGFAGEAPRFNPLNTSRPQSSTLLNINDPIQVHLLVETALGDSQEYEVLAPEEVDELKKQCQWLTQRIEQTRQNLAIQSKYRDAAISMAKLYSPTERKSRSSILHHKSDSVEKADIERMQSEKKCEDLAGELWSLEKRLMEPQSRLLKHTAGILQMTHKGPKKGAKGAGAQQNGIPGSPESMYTYHNARHSMEPADEMFFDERSLYRSADHLDAFGDFGRDSPPPKSQGREQMQMIAKTEQTLEDLNKRLREVIIKANPQKQNTYELPPLAKTNEQGRPTDPGETLQSHLDYLEKSISEIDHEHSQSARYQLEQERAMEETVEGLNREIRGLLLPYDPNHREPPELTGSGLKQQLLYFQDAVGAVEMELSSNAGKNGMQDNVEQMETVLIGLWDIIQAGEQDIRKRKQERRAARTVQGLPPDAEDDSPDEEGDYDEPFSLQAFSAKVQRLYSQATRLKDQKTVLQRQIKQQRELNSKSDATKDAEMQSKEQELERVKALLVRTETDADHVREQLSEVMEKLDAHDQERSGNESTQAELEMRNARINDLEEQLHELKDDHNIHNAEIQTKISDYESKIQILTAEVAAAVASQVAAQTSVQAKEQEMEGMNMELARLQTEVTIARAELDGAYGTRAQRAAEVAANPVIQKEIDDLTKSNDLLAAEIAQLKSGGGSGGEKVKELKKELQEVVEEYERMTKEGIEWEKEREKMEAEIDRLREERERMEGELSDEKVRWLGVSPGGENGVREGTSTGVLKAEFKKMMRDTRADGLRALRAEQAERRRLEDELRALKKSQGPGKSSLSQVNSPY